MGRNPSRTPTESRKSDLVLFRSGGRTKGRIRSGIFGDKLNASKVCHERFRGSPAEPLMIGLLELERAAREPHRDQDSRNREPRCYPCERKPTSASGGLCHLPFVVLLAPELGPNASFISPNAARAAGKPQ